MTRLVIGAGRIRVDNRQAAFVFDSTLSRENGLSMELGTVNVIVQKPICLLE